jgi:hypothetical protein
MLVMKFRFGWGSPTTLHNDVHAFIRNPPA